MTTYFLLLVLISCSWSSFAFVQQPAFRSSHPWRGPSNKVVTTKLEVSATDIDPSVEAELCTTIAHVALDFTGLMSPSKSIIRLFAVIGRLFAISADYIPDHSIHTEELTIQMFLLALATRELLAERVASAANATSSNEGRA